MTKPSPVPHEQLTVQVRTYCEGQYIRYEFRDDDEDRGEAWPVARRVVLPKIISLVHYLTALHEIGHVLTHDRSGRTLEREAYAWLWALRFAQAWLKDIPSDVRKACADKLMSHMFTAKRKGLWFPQHDERNIVWDALHLLLAGDKRRTRRRLEG